MKRKYKPMYDEALYKADPGYYLDRGFKFWGYMDEYKKDYTASGRLLEEIQTRITEQIRADIE